jgi:hypothetical protein
MVSQRQRGLVRVRVGIPALIFGDGMGAIDIGKSQNKDLEEQ